MSASRVCMICVILVQAFLAEAGPGLRGQPQPQVNMKTVETSLLAELSGAFRGGGAMEHISSLEEELVPMYTAVPKEADGTLGHPVVRYMLHRFFSQKHGWFIRGLEPNSANQAASGNQTSGNQTLQNLQEWVPSYLQNFLEELQGGRGLSLRELAVLAATLEDLIHKEAVTRLEMTFKALELPEGTLLDQARMHQALEVWMMIYMLGGNFTVKGEKGVLRAHGIFTKKVKDWAAVQDWMHNIQLELFPTSDDQALDFGAATRVVEEVGKRYGDYNGGECSNLKNTLLEIESQKAGRVRLAEFYKKGLAGTFDFNEKIEYLRTLGVLDESDPAQPHVIVPNYVASRPNCLKASEVYVVCCRNECEDLLGALERKFESSTVRPEQILEQVASLSSKTVEAPRKLSDSLAQRLHGIAQANHGRVPLHGRLFAQWMHHAFPRECPYPHQAGTTSPQTPDEWMTATGQEDSKKTMEELKAHVDGDDQCTLPKGAEAREHHNLKENELPWDEAEELLLPVGAIRTAEVALDDLPQPHHITMLSLLPALLWKLGYFATIAFGLAFMVWKLTASGKEDANIVTFVQHLFRGRHSSKAGMLPRSQRSSDLLF